MKRYLILLLTGVVISSQAENMYTFKDSNGQVLLTDVVNNGKPAGETFQKFAQTVKVTYYADTNAYSFWHDTEKWENMTDKQILQSVENPTDKDGNAVEISSDEKQKNLQYAKEYIYERNLAKKPATKIGMTKNQVRNHTNWGEPNSINKTVTAQGTFEQWVYDDFQYLYFKNGKLTTIQTHE